MKTVFATCLNCMDGRVQMPVINWIKDNYGVDCVDMITEAGLDCVLSEEVCPLKDDLLKKIQISAEKHGSAHIFISGHSDCGGNPVDDETHKRQILKAVDRVKSWVPSMTACGLWVSDKWEVEKLVER